METKKGSIMKTVSTNDFWQETRDYCECPYCGCGTSIENYQGINVCEVCECEFETE